MSTSYTERSSSERIIRSFDVAGMQIIPKVRQAVLVCDGKAGSDPETHPQAGGAGCFPLGKAGFGIWVGAMKKKNVIPKKCYLKKVSPPKKCNPPKNAISRKCCPQKMLCPKNVIPEKCCPPKMISPKNAVPKNTVPKKCYT